MGSKVLLDLSGLIGYILLNVILGVNTSAMFHGCLDVPFAVGIVLGSTYSSSSEPILVP
jgi:hypothetical protein